MDVKNMGQMDDFKGDVHMPFLVHLTQTSHPAFIPGKRGYLDSGK